MSYSGGVFSINTSGQPVVSGTTISASVFNALTGDLATGLSTCMLKDGTQTATAGIGFYAGTVSLPGIYFGTDTTTGFYRIGLNNTGFAINGTKLLDLSATTLGVTGVITASSTVTGLTFVPTGSSVPTNGMYLPAANTIGFATNTGLKFSVDATGMFGLGVAPSSGTRFYALGTTTDNSANTALLSNSDGSSTWVFRNDGQQQLTSSSTVRMTMTAGGVFLLGTTATNFGETGTKLGVRSSPVTSADRAVHIWNDATSGDNGFVAFETEGGGSVRGSITYNRGGGLVAYNTTSDYRAKDVFGKLSGVVATLSSFNVYDGQMKGASIHRPMLIAHEAQRIAPWAVTGEKDAVDSEGRPVYQQLSEGSFAPLLIAGWQDHESRLTQDRTDIDAIKLKLGI